jgi:hypothetical protein
MIFKNPDPRVKHAKDVRFRAPLYPNLTANDVTRSIVPDLIHVAFRKLVPLPSVLYHWTDGVHNIETTDAHQAFDFVGRQRPIDRELTFDRGLTELVNISRFPTKDHKFWYRISIDSLSMAFGGDISNGLSQMDAKYRWENRINGKCPPTLGENGEGEVLWKDMPDPIDASFIDGDADNLKDFCPASSPDKYEEAFRRVNGDELKVYDLISIDPATGRLKEKDVSHLTSEKPSAPILIECNRFCPCGGNCPCRVTSRPCCPDLALFYSEAKGWGVVATNDIEAGTFICVYVGVLKDEKDEDGKEGLYSFGLVFAELSFPYEYDSSVVGNIGRFINGAHWSKDVKFSQPNTVGIPVIPSKMCTGVVGIFSGRKIWKGEELTIDYGPDFWKHLDKCCCNTCVTDRMLEKRKHSPKYK